LFPKSSANFSLLDPNGKQNFKLNSSSLAFEENKGIKKRKGTGSLE
jgi:hypothetical protein